ncbi:MAG: NAD(P)H-dependent glycerol-3-phosphate dehydrogenase [Acidimicrobiales bacterium]
MDVQVAVVGAGSWGTTVAALASRNASTRLWCREADLAAAITRDHMNPVYLEGFTLPSTLVATPELGEAVSDADIVVMAVPSHAFREILEAVAPLVGAGAHVVSVAKGLERGTGMRMTEVVADVVPGHLAGALTGPNLAKEILAGDAAASVIAMSDDAVAAVVQQVFASPRFKVYTNHDVVGCELGGALKNVYAIASGMADGLGTGDNTRAAVITRSLAELTRLGVAMGGEPATFAGLAGLGDLIATCTSSQSRNRHVGEELGRGRSVSEVVDAMNQVAEGVETAEVVVRLAAAHDVAVPIAAMVSAVISGEMSAAEAYRGLLRPARGHESDPENW